MSGTLAHPRSSISRMYICMYVCTHVHTHVHACRLRSLPSFLCTCRGVLCSRTTTPCHTQQQNEKETPLVQSRPTTMFLLCGSIQRRLPPVIHTHIHTYIHTYTLKLSSRRCVPFQIVVPDSSLISRVSSSGLGALHRLHSWPHEQTI